MNMSVNTPIFFGFQPEVSRVAGKITFDNGKLHAIFQKPVNNQLYDIVPVFFITKSVKQGDTVVIEEADLMHFALVAKRET